MLTSSLRHALSRQTHYKDLLEVMDYAVFPAGKMFRPRLVEALAQDLGELTQDHLHLASALEIHHAYTLVHDDLPAMDNDAMRRGKPSTHMAFGEWRAILAGDALLIASFNELMKVEGKSHRELHRLFAWATGAKGLIYGQFLDLNAKGQANLKQVIRIHELKTARLIQVATLGTHLISFPHARLKEKVEFLRLGREIGVSFQLLDDLSELGESSVSPHEQEINPFLTSPIEALRELKLSHTRLQKIIQNNKLIALKKMLDDYFEKGQKGLKEGLPLLRINLKNDSALCALEEWITTFANT
jgi:geranylgeranyl pyrophosphate synthase